MRQKLSRQISWPGFTAQLFGLVVLPLAFLTMIIAFGGLSLHRQAMRTMVGERDERAVRATASAIFEQINHREKAIRGLVLLASLRAEGVALDELLEHSSYLRTDFDYGLAFYDRSGVQLAAGAGAEFWDALAASAPGFSEAIVRDAPPALQVLPHPESREPVIVTFAVESKGGVIAV